MAARLREHYLKQVVPTLTKEFGYSNPMAVPKIEKISINIGLGEATQNAKLMDGAVNELTSIAGQKPVVTKASKSIAQFKLREGQAIEKFEHAIAAQRDHAADGLAFAQFELGDALAGLGDHRLLAGDLLQFIDGAIHQLGVLRGFAQADVDRDFFNLRHGHNVLVAEFLGQARNDFR